ncbi:hypothetical protein OpiT1DRAFT_03274 [Opitutaceae bacterium TAV1]|nr:hypothetical protein OpiT1DRAFT_03274 [Opitutaceae bacterium TAV1]
MNSDLSRRVLDFANRLEIQPVRPSRLLVVREAILAFRAKNYSYEHIAGLLKPQGIIISGSSVGAFCRKHCSSAEIIRVRKEISRREDRLPAVPGSLPVVLKALPPRLSLSGSPRGPTIARDDF